MEVTIRVQDPSGTVVRDVLVRSQESNTVADLVAVLVEVMEWPRATFAGADIPYRLRRLGSEAALDPRSPFAALGLKQGEAVILGPA